MENPFVPRNSHEKPRVFNLNRRNFLKLASLIGLSIVGTSALNSFLCKKVIEYFRQGRYSDEEVEKLINRIRKQGEELEEEPPTIEQINIEIQDMEKLAGKYKISPNEKINFYKILSFEQKGFFEFDRENIKIILGSIYSKWKKDYSIDGKRYPDLLSALERMKKYYHEINPIFEKKFFLFDKQSYEINENQKEKFKKLVYLAIPESHFQLEARSTAEAVGPYQFIKKTAEQAGLKIEKGIDERKNPIKSAEACANLMAYLLNKMDNFSIALSSYNGGFAWKFKEDNSTKNLDYYDFVVFILNRIQKRRSEIKKNKCEKYTIKKGDTLEEISKKYFVKTKNIKLAKKHPKNKKIIIKPGEEVLIWLDKEAQEKMYNKELLGVIENLNYPAKYFAVLKNMEENNLFLDSPSA